MFHESVKKLSIDDFNNHPKYFVLVALQTASIEDSELFLRCFQKVAEEGFRKSQDFVIDGIPKQEGNPYSVFFENEEIERPNMECFWMKENTVIKVPVICGVCRADEGTWLEFTKPMAEGIKELLGLKFSPYRLFGD